MRQVRVAEAKAQLSSFLDAVASGEPVLSTRRDKAITELVPRRAVPDLWLGETGNVLVQAERRGRITSAAFQTFLALLETLPIRIDQPSTASTWHDTLALARSHRLTTDDAAYLELALRRGLPLACRDQTLQAAARLQGVPLLPR